MRGFTHYPALLRRQSDRGKSKSIEATCARRRHDCLYGLAVRAGLYTGLLTLVGSISYGQTLSVTPSSGAVFEGGTVQFTSNKPVNWSMATGSAGTLTVNSSTSATFAAPAEYLPNNVLAGCQTTPNDTVWNTRIDNLPVLTQVNGDTSQSSAVWMQTMYNFAAPPNYYVTVVPDWGTNIATSSTPLVNEKFYYTDATATFPVPPLNVQKREGGTLVTHHAPLGASSDHRIQTVSRDYCQFYELYNNYFSPENCADGTAGCTATGGLSFPWSSYTLPQNGSSAANLPYFPLTLHLSEIKKGVINHALAFTSETYIIDNLKLTSYWPAYQTYGKCTQPACASAPPYGARFRLKASFQISDSYSQETKTILTALKQYGMFLTDASSGAGSGEVYADGDLTEDPAVLKALAEISNAKIEIATNFEVVDESSFEMSPFSSEVNPANGYESPSSYSVVQATDQANPSSVVSVPVAVESNTPGVSSPTLYVVAGTPGYPLASWFRAGHYPGVQWSLTSGVGSVTANGIYTPPSSVTGPTIADLKVASAQNANESEDVYVTVLPASSDGSVRIDSGSLAATTDAETPPHTWSADQGFETTYPRQTPLAYPRWTVSDPDVLIYETTLSNETHDDIVYSFAIPNGNYKVRLMFGESKNGATTNTFNPLLHAAMNLESNGQIAAHNYNYGTPIAYAYNTPSDAYIPAQVTDQNLYVAIRLNLPDSALSQFPQNDGLSSQTPFPSINGLEIIPDTSAAHLVIDTQQQTSVTAGNTLQLYAVGWYMSNSVTWAVASGPGSIDQNGLYTAPDNAGSSPQTVTIRATSTTNGAIIATATLTIPAAS